MGRELDRAHTPGPRHGEAGWEPGRDQVEQGLGAIEALQRVGAEVDRREAVPALEQVGRCAREEDLASVGCRADPGRAVNLDARVSVRRPHRVSGVDADACPDLDSLGPVARSECALDLDGRRGRVFRARERAEGAVTVVVHHRAAVPADGSREDFAVWIEDTRRIGRAQEPDDGSRPVDVGEEQRDGPLG